VDPVPDPQLVRKSGSAGNQTRDLWIFSQELCPLDHRYGPYDIRVANYSILYVQPIVAFKFYYTNDQWRLVAKISGGAATKIVYLFHKLGDGC
jgi:hypothetical protein